MRILSGALVALLLAAAVTAVASAGVLAMPALDPTPPLSRLAETWVRDSKADFIAADRGVGSVRDGVLAGTPVPSTPASAAAEFTPMPATPTSEVRGIGSNYPGTAGWMGQATVALPGDLGGRYNGMVNGHVTVCADRCARLPIVDWCQCYWATADQRVVDLSHAAWQIVSDAPLEEGLIEVRVILEG
ncbi:MAG: hypothetical protein ACRDGV_04535 [Candidatus Limnocylindria bacterium]